MCVCVFFFFFFFFFFFLFCFFLRVFWGFFNYNLTIAWDKQYKKNNMLYINFNMNFLFHFFLAMVLG